MKKEKWKECIVNACQEAKTYKPYFDSPIDTLSQILETRDLIHDKWVEEGCEPTIIHTNKAGMPNTTKNPLLTLENDLNSQALTYWRDLGLTPSGLKKLNVDIVKDENSVSFEDLLNSIENG